MDELEEAEVGGVEISIFNELDLTTCDKFVLIAGGRCCMKLISKAAQFI
jgi:hypothetical protein